MVDHSLYFPAGNNQQENSDVIKNIYIGFYAICLLRLYKCIKTHSNCLLKQFMLFGEQNV